MRPNLILLLILLGAGLNASAQKENNIWAFGKGAGLNFNNGVPVTWSNSMNAESGCASVCSPSGTLLFYSNGATIWDRNHNVMPNGSGLLSNWNTSAGFQNVSIVPFVNDTNKYYVFTRNATLYYSVVDMSLNNSNGDVLPAQKNIKLGTGLGSEMVVAPGSNCNIWLLTHRDGLNRFSAYEITESGINTVPVVSNCGSYVGTMTYKSGMLKVAPSGKKIAITSMTIAATVTPSFIDLFDFNPQTGIVSNAQLVDFTFLSSLMGICFSPDETKLYSTDPQLGMVHQYDITLGSATAIKNSKTAVGFTPDCGDLQIGPDQKIYVTTNFQISQTVVLDRIDNPNIAGSGCNYITSAVTLSTGTETRTFLTNRIVIPQQDTIINIYNRLLCGGKDLYLKAPSGYLRYYFQDRAVQDTSFVINTPGRYRIVYENHCQRIEDVYEISAYDLNSGLSDTAICNNIYALELNISGNTPVGTKYRWQDNTTGPLYTVIAPGKYWVRMNSKGCEQTDTFHVSTKPHPVFDLGKDTPLCEGEFYLLQVPIRGDSYEWQDGSSNSSFKIQEKGTYRVVVGLDNCYQSDELNVGIEYCDCIAFVPNAFSPNGDGLNDRFVPNLKCGSLDVRMHLTIYNRWGQMIFETNQIDNTWDGSFKGTALETGTYFYNLSYTNRQTTAVKKGEVILLR